MKLLCWNCRGLGNPAIVRELKQLIVANNPDIIFLSETTKNANGFPRIQNLFRMRGGLAMSSEGRSGGIALMSREGVDVAIHNYSKHRIDSLVQLENQCNLIFTGFYGYEDPNLRSSSWDMLRRVGGSVREDWVGGGDFNAILNDAEKEGDRRKVRAHINDFKDIIDEMDLVDIKPDKGWFTWVNNREGSCMIKERLDRFLTSVSAIDYFPYMAASFVRQTKYNHDAILLDMWGRKPKEQLKDPRLCIKYDECWAKDREAKDIINSAWNRCESNIIDKLERVRSLEWKIDKVVDTSQRDHSAAVLKEASFRLSHLYAKEEKYWAQRSRIKWLKEGDRNTRYFHVRATSRFKKNNIAKLKDSNGRWVTETKDICNVAREYFSSLFRSNTSCYGNHDMSYIQYIKQMDPRKAPGVNSLSGNFFKNNWECE
ncbi:hypothetical protein ES288_D05G347900v1 [Gossypium darwinii]|uniref:Endonuclease/exonuclease/phosphatase domain-containing protein n=1 Tax=Gossypium darwinii TaxID=34276 RepID=A0A5D2CMR2_GOSDA|nr:hypothetical protein ES288_D05G347900v1 [Gossypium darwinii]